MAQEKLLFFLMLLMLCSPTALGGEEFRFKKEDLEFAKYLTKKSQQMTLGEMNQKWLELQNMLGSIKEGNKQDNKILPGSEHDSEWGVSFRIFVSSSMSKNLLKNYATKAKKYCGVLVFNGLPGGSWRKLSELVTEISGDKPQLVAMQIDDEAFAQFNITEVPSFVLSKEEDMFAENPKLTFDKVTGSIGIRRALEMFEEKGQLKDIAAHKLQQVLVDE
jgi:type-F conjugative transfer system pilin assembly protein TrbC